MLRNLSQKTILFLLINFCSFGTFKFYKDAAAQDTDDLTLIGNSDSQYAAENNAGSEVVFQETPSLTDESQPHSEQFDDEEPVVENQFDQFSSGPANSGTGQQLENVKPEDQTTEEGIERETDQSTQSQYEDYQSNAENQQETKSELQATDLTAHSEESSATASQPEYRNRLTESTNQNEGATDLNLNPSNQEEAAEIGSDYYGTETVSEFNAQRSVAEGETVNSEQYADENNVVVADEYNGLAAAQQQRDLPEKFFGRLGDQPGISGKSGQDGQAGQMHKIPLLPQRVAHFMNPAQQHRGSSERHKHQNEHTAGHVSELPMGGGPALTSSGPKGLTNASSGAPYPSDGPHPPANSPLLTPADAHVNNNTRPPVPMVATEQGPNGTYPSLERPRVSMAPPPTAAGLGVGQGSTTSSSITAAILAEASGNVSLSSVVPPMVSPVPGSVQPNISLGNASSSHGPMETHPMATSTPIPITMSSGMPQETHPPAPPPTATVSVSALSNVSQTPSPLINLPQGNATQVPTPGGINASSIPIPALANLTTMVPIAQSIAGGNATLTTAQTGLGNISAMHSPMPIVNGSSIPAINVSPTAAPGNVSFPPVTPGPGMNVSTTVQPPVPGNVSVLGDIKVTPPPLGPGNVNITGPPPVSGNMSVTGQQPVTENVSIPGNKSVTIQPPIPGNMNVTVPSQIPGIMKVTGQPPVSGNATTQVVSGNASIAPLPGNASIAPLPGNFSFPPGAGSPPPQTTALPVSTLSPVGRTTQTPIANPTGNETGFLNIVEFVFPTAEPQKITEDDLVTVPPFCKEQVPRNGRDLGCQWDEKPGQQLYYWNRGNAHPEVSKCVVAGTVQECKALCESLPSCRSMHYCSACADFSCHLFTAKSGDDITLQQVFNYVDYYEKGPCKN